MAVGGRERVAMMAVRDEWLAQTVEEVIDPSREIVDPHHHLWTRSGHAYEMEQLWADCEAGHNIVQTMYMECFARLREDGPEAFRCVGETEYVADVAAEMAKQSERAQLVAIVAGCDLRLPQLDAVLDAHEDAGQGLFVGIRQAGSRDADPDALMIAGRGPEGLYQDPAFRKGVARLGERGLTYDTWHYHHQALDFLDLARSVPGTTLVLDHFGTPLGVGRFAGKRDSIFAAWKDDMAALAECPNVIAKLGGLAMPDNGYGWHERDVPIGSDEFVDAQGAWYAHMIACFGPERCMFESNFPVDRCSISANVLWNGFKKVAADLDETAQERLFAGTARAVYGVSK